MCSGVSGIGCLCYGAMHQCHFLLVPPASGLGCAGAQEKERLKKEKERDEDKFKWAYVDGRKEQVIGNN